MARLVRKVDLGDPAVVTQQDALWDIQPDGTGIPVRRGAANTLAAVYNSAPGSKALLASGSLVLDADLAMTAHDIAEFDAGTAVRLADGSITHNNANLVVEA